MSSFEIRPQNPETYRQQTRRSTLVVAATFAFLAMGLSSMAVAMFGEPGGDNLRLNIAGVVAGLLLTIALVRTFYWEQPWMASAVYGWRLKRSLMSVTNVMHHVKAGVAAGDETAMKLLRFYHLGLTQMHQLDANSSSLLEVRAEIEGHKERMQAQGLDLDQQRLEAGWIDTVKKIDAAK
ncbi:MULTISPECIES: DUF3087 domain-containing protein [Pseudomonadaceae]|jgi:hypothetical protein|uniref:DUF3087 domain-containing protein n=1 Tax=Pseudomonadaceae TaxID=135621 RepID=UPI000F7969FF|nr:MULTISPECIES: DUF3087 domain-containing protein [Pseudomonadaceae]MCF6783070.1 DUF3087 domain-containing protein [Stutzerimonas stutzeri]MCF6806018.1 DUF3087 domain-containing protein [Stutzerimonas stutzeri]RRV14975.1 DUF3087 domain-containing protein [Pseudomonas saudiphocaensis]